MAVISVGAIHGGDAPNVIPGSVLMRLTVRAYRPEIRAMLRERITALVQAQAATLGVQAEVDYHWRYPALVNDVASTDFARQVALDWLGDEGLMPNLQPLTGSEDFSFMLEQCPGSYLIVATAWVMRMAAAVAWCTTPATTSTTPACRWHRPTGSS